MISAASIRTTPKPSETPTLISPNNIEFTQEGVEIDKLNTQPHDVKTKMDKWNLLKVRVGFDVTRKGERSLVIDGYKFTKSRDGMSDRVFWRCSRRECKATAVTVGGRVEHVRTLHTHQPPTPGEFYSTAAETTKNPGSNATTCDQTVRQNGSGRIRRKSHQITSNVIKSINELPEEILTMEKTTNEHARAVAAILSNLVERRQTEHKKRKIHEIDCSPNSSTDQQRENIFPLSSNVEHQRAVQTISFGNAGINDISDNRGLSALADAAVHQSKRDSQNSTPDPPFEAPVPSPPLPLCLQTPHLLPLPTQTTNILSPRSHEKGDTVAATPLKAQFVLIGTPNFSGPFLMGNAGVRPCLSTLPTALNTSISSVAATTSNYFSISQPSLPSSSPSGIHHSYRPCSEISEFPNNHSHQEGSLCDTPSRGDFPVISMSTTAGINGGILHWKKEKMRESEAEELKLHCRRRHLTGNGTSSASCPIDEDTHDCSSMPTPSKRKRCVSASHPQLSSTSSLFPVGPCTAGDKSNTISSRPMTSSTEQPMSDLCTRVQNDLLAQMLATLQQLSARLSADADAESVITNCRAIQACLDTISTLKRVHQDLTGL